MPDVRYSQRRNFFSPRRTFWIESNAIAWSRGDSAEDRMAFADVKEIRWDQQFMPGEAAIQKKMMWRLRLRSRTGRRLILSPADYVRFRYWEDRSAQYAEFTNRLLGELRKFSPHLQVVSSKHWTVRLRLATRRTVATLGGHIMASLFRLIRRLDLDRTSRALSRAMQRIGPWLRGHRVARANLKAAFPDKSAAEIDLILQDMWKNFGRVMGEYAFFDRLWDFDPSAPGTTRIVIEQDTLDRVARMRDLKKPVLYFAAHLANWELPPVAAKELGLNCVTVYRPLQFGAVAGQIIAMRSQVMGTLIPAGSGAARRLKGALDHGQSINMLIDQHFVGGVDALFFGRRCKVNPTFGRLARLLDCTVCGSRVVRLPDDRYRCELTEPLVLPRDKEGKVDVAGAMQVMTWMIEGWIREHPDQWLWMHRRWR